MRAGSLASVTTHLAHWRRILVQVPDGGAALVVSSGGSIEPVLVAAFPDADHGSWEVRPASARGRHADRGR